MYNTGMYIKLEAVKLFFKDKLDLNCIAWRVLRIK